MIQKELKLASFSVKILTEDQRKVELAKDLKKRKWIYVVFKRPKLALDATLLSRISE